MVSLSGGGDGLMVMVMAKVVAMRGPHGSTASNKRAFQRTAITAGTRKPLTRARAAHRRHKAVSVAPDSVFVFSPATPRGRPCRRQVRVFMKMVGPRGRQQHTEDKTKVFTCRAFRLIFKNAPGPAANLPRRCARPGRSRRT